MLRSTTITGLNRIASTSGLCVCKMMDRIVKFIGDSGDKSEWVESVSYTHLTLPTIYSV